MGNKEHDDSCNHPQRLLAILAIFDPVLIHQGKGVFEYVSGIFESDSVLAFVILCFDVIPFEQDPSTRL